MRLICVTGSEQRHKFIGFHIGQIACDGIVVLEEPHNQAGQHFSERAIKERRLLPLSNKQLNKLENGCIKTARGELNENKCLLEKLSNFQPDIIFFYGCSLISQLVIDAFSCPLVNIHLGLSPYYRGSGTNFWPLYNKEPEYVGVTFHKLTSKIDDGYIYLQRRATSDMAYDVHEYGLNLIGGIPKDVQFFISKKIITRQPEQSFEFAATPRHYYKRSDFEEKDGKYVAREFQQIISDYKANLQKRNKAVPIKSREFYK